MKLAGRRSVGCLGGKGGRKEAEKSTQGVVDVARGPREGRDGRGPSRSCLARIWLLLAGLAHEEPVTYLGQTARRASHASRSSRQRSSRVLLFP